VGSTYSFREVREWLEKSPEEKFFFWRFTQLTVTSAAVMGNDVRKMTEAWELWDKVCADDRVAYLSEPEAIEPEFRRRSRLVLLRRKCGRIPIFGHSQPWRV
jgi:hypothetical protein